MKHLTVISPAYLEESVIEVFYTELRKVLDGIANHYRSDVLFVVDYCNDNTLSILKRIAAVDDRVRILALSSRFGHQASLLAGIDHCQSDVVIMLDSDLQHPPELIPKMLEEYGKGYDIVYTIRKTPLPTNILRQFASDVFYKLINLLSSVHIDENAADFRLISRKVVLIFQNEIRERNQFIRGLMGWVGFKRIGIPFEVKPRHAGKTKYSVKRLIKFSMEGIISFSKRPLQLTIIAGFAVALFACYFSLLTLYQYVTMDRLPSGWTTLVLINSIFSGVILISMGIIGIYIGAIFDEVKARPSYLIDEKIGFKDP